MYGYFEHLCQLIKYEGVSYTRYTKLLSFLYNLDFRWIIFNDKNRAIDGLVLREDYFHGEDLLQRPCSVLEMLIAMSIRCEYDIMHEPKAGDMTGKWFFMMLDNAGLLAFDDFDFDIDAVSSIIFRCLDRTYLPSGEGGFFPLKHPTEDMRYVEIWSQLNRYLDENYDF